MIVLVDYGMGNLRSVQKAFQYYGADLKTSSLKKDVEKAGKIVLPGVGAFGEAMDNLKKLGILETLSKEVLVKKKPI